MKNICEENLKYSTRFSFLGETKPQKLGHHSMHHRDLDSGRGLENFIVSALRHATRKLLRSCAPYPRIWLATGVVSRDPRQIET
jgi:hypothetical protein